jgi:hypothetical protein
MPSYSRSRSLDDERPQVPHLLPRRHQGGLSGEILDLRLDLDDAFERLEWELDVYTTVQDENVLVLQGATKFNFMGAGVAASLDGLDPRKVNIFVPGTSPGGSGCLQVVVDHTMWPGPALIGTLDAGRTVEKTTIEVLEDWDNQLQVTVGDAVGEGRLFTVHDSNLTRTGEVFLVESGYRYLISTPLNVYFVGPLPPTRGALRVIVYFS